MATDMHATENVVLPMRQSLGNGLVNMLPQEQIRLETTEELL
jgi:hypothetical protein